MISVFVGETGGKVTINDTSFIAIRSIQLFGQSYTEYTTISGAVASGNVEIQKREFATLPAGYYTLLIAGDTSAIQTKQYSYDVQVRRRR